MAAPPARRLEPGEDPRWGVLDAVVGIVLAQIVSLFAAVMLLGAFHEDGFEADIADLSLGWLAVLQVPLWLSLLGSASVAVWFRGRSFREDFGLSIVPADVPIGLAIGVGLQVIVVTLLYLPFTFFFDLDVSEEARELTDKASDTTGVILLFIGVGLIAPFVEEIFYRGFLLRALERRFSGRQRGLLIALVVSAVVFGAIHLQPLQFPALTVVGAVFAWVVQRHGRLGRAIWAHIGFNCTAVASLVFLG